MDVAVEFEQRIQRVVACSERTAARMRGEAESDDLPPFAELVPGAPDDELATMLGLSLDEVELMWSVVARSLDARVAMNAREAFGLDARFGLSLAHHIAWCELSIERQRRLLAVLDPRHPLRTAGILVPTGDEPLDINTPWTTSPRISAYLRGEDAMDPHIASIGGFIVPGATRVSTEQQQLVGRLRAWLLSPSAATIVVEGAHSSGKRTAIALAAAPRRVIAADFARVSPRRAEVVITALRREALLADAIPVLANLDELWNRLPPGDDTLVTLGMALEAFPGPLVVTTSTAGIELHAGTRAVLRARWPLPDPIARRELWNDVLGDAVPADELDLVAHRYELGAGGILAAARSALHRAEHHRRTPMLDDVASGIQDNIAERLGELAKRVEVRQEWTELVLPPDTLNDIKALIARIRHAHFVLDRWGFRRKLARGTGVAALFSGPPGTGKTMVAGLLARELQLELYQVDLSRIVSKWVGETEKQLAKVFEAAEAGHALLLFDEADALFAKRSAEVKSAVDRYANLEVNYLLQRVESFGGIVILTTNLDTSIDPALRRRLASHIVFTPPEVEERVALWREMLATGAPLQPNLDFRALAEEFSQMTAANIRNAVIAAAFLAAEDGTHIGHTHLLRAARSEYRAMGHVLTRSERSSSL